MNIFVTGNRGYIGVHLVEFLKAHGHRVTGCDLNLFDGCNWADFVRPDVELIKDFRSLTIGDLEEHDCCIHLAAISNDSMGDLDIEITRQVNAKGSVELASKAKAAGVGRFLFASSCSMYGCAERLDLDETASLNPVSAYARSKTLAEQGIGTLADEDFCPTFLRNATAYGDSPMLRIDLVVNNLLACAVARGEIRIMSDGTPWRPFIHCRDIASAFIAFMKAPPTVIRNKAVNVGGNAENHQIKDVADLVKGLVPKAEIVFTGEIGHDQRDYRVNFDLLNTLLPSFEMEYTLERGMEELHRKLNDYGFGEADFDGDRFVRLRTLKHSLHLLGPSDRQVDVAE
jgi:nucleoside-diphosphate-sugar epimerase